MRCVHAGARLLWLIWKSKDESEVLLMGDKVAETNFFIVGGGV